MFPGIEGGQWSLTEVRRAFRDAGVQSAIYTHDWQRPPLLGTLSNLSDYKGNRKAAQSVAEEIVKYKDRYPQAPVDLVGYSGGGGMAIMTAEALPKSLRLRNIILVHAAISPDYPLDPALQHVDGQLTNYYSPADWLLLGVGTRLFGTMDRKHCQSAGKVGFDLTAAIQDPNLSSKFEQCSWTMDEFKKGEHFGGHGSIIFYDWNKNKVAPYLQPVQ